MDSTDGIDGNPIFEGTRDRTRDIETIQAVIDLVLTTGINGNEFLKS